MDDGIQVEFKFWTLDVLADCVLVKWICWICTEYNDFGKICDFGINSSACCFYSGVKLSFKKRFALFCMLCSSSFKLSLPIFRRGLIILIWIVVFNFATLLACV